MLAFWEQSQIFEKLREKNRGGPRWSFLDGPITANNPRPEKTIGQFWPYATTLFDTIRRAMPMQAPGTLRDAQTDALCTCVLHLNAIIGAEAVKDATTLPRVRMPNRDGFVMAPRADSALR